MNQIFEVCLVALTLAASFTPSAAAKPVAGSQNSLFAGTWEGNINNLPGINLKIQAVDRNVSGNIVSISSNAPTPAGRGTSPAKLPYRCWHRTSKATRSRTKLNTTNAMDVRSSVPT